MYDLFILAGKKRLKKVTEDYTDEIVCILEELTPLRARMCPFQSI